LFNEPEADNNGEVTDLVPGDLLWKRKTDLLLDITDRIESRVEEDVRTFHPIYQDLRIHAFVNQFGPSQLLSLLSESTGESKKMLRVFTRLKRLILTTFMSDCNLAAKANPAIGHEIMNSSPYVSKFLN
jgi:hypothetical protein